MIDNTVSTLRRRGIFGMSLSISSEVKLINNHNLIHIL